MYDLRFLDTAHPERAATNDPAVSTELVSLSQLTYVSSRLSTSGALAARAATPSVVQDTSERPWEKTRILPDSLAVITYQSEAGTRPKCDVITPRAVLRRGPRAYRVAAAPRHYLIARFVSARSVIYSYNNVKIGCPTFLI